jgi:hypothetical protein
MLFAGGAKLEYRCYGICSYNDDCAQFCKKIDNRLDGFCEKGTCCCAPPPPPPRM